MRDTSKDIFVRHHFDLKLNGITHFQVQNEMMLVALNGQNLYHIRLQNSRQTNLKMPIELHDRIAHLHLDFNGVHGFASTVAGENFYVNMRSGILKPLKRLKGLVVSAIAWNSEFSKDSETGFILLGTTRGFIYETNISSSGSLNYFKQLSANFTEKDLSISDLHLRQLGDADTADFLLLICAPNRLYCLNGPANLQAANQQPAQQVVGTVWSSVMVDSGQEAVLQQLFNFKGKKPQYLSMCKDKDSEVPPSALAVFPLSSEELQPTFAWLAADGLSIGAVETNKWKKDTASPDGSHMLSIGTKLNHRRSEGRLDYPLDICLTEFHLLLLYTNRLAAISLLDRTLAFEDFYTGVPKVVGMSRDASSHLIWVFSDSMAFKYRPNDESRNVWRIFMEQKEFGKAKKIANQLQDKRPFQTIIKREAQKFLAEKNFVAAAESLAQSSEPIEKLVLLLTREGPSGRNGLKRFLELKLGQLHGNEDRMHRDMLVLWLLEIQLAELAELRRNTTADETGNSSSTAETTQIQGQQEAEIRQLKDQLFCFLNRPIVFEAISDNQAAVYRAISSHVDFDVQRYLAQKLRDHRTVIKILLMQNLYVEALDILARERRPELFYEFADQLVVEVPEKLVLLLRQENNRALNPVKLLPAFHKCLDPELTNRAKILDTTFAFVDHFCSSSTASNAPSALLDFAINLFATFRPRELLPFLKKCLRSRRGPPPFDVARASRICAEHGLTECRVFLLCVEGLFEDAVKLALGISIDLAKQCARELEEKVEQREQESLADFVMDERGVDLRTVGPATPHMLETRRRIWLEIAKNMIQSGAPIANCLKLLDESNGAIRIQDVLGHFPEFTKIEHFKQPLLSCLKEYSNEIKQLQREIGDATEMAEELRQEMDKSRSGFMVVRTSGQCAFCKGTLLQRPFVAFVCRHFFHRDCLEAKVKTASEEYSNLEAEERVLKKEVQLASATAANGRTKAAGRRERGSREEMASKKLESIRSRMRELLCGDCPLCGLQTIEDVDKPFFDTPEAYLEQLKLWMP